LISISESGSVAVQKNQLRTAVLMNLLKSDALADGPPRPALPRLKKDAPISRFSVFVFRRYRDAPPCSSVITTAPIIEHFRSPQWLT
jgi:hypothetical protein